MSEYLSVSSTPEQMLYRAVIHLKYPAINQSRQTPRREYERKPGIIRIINSIHDLSHTTNSLLYASLTYSFLLRPVLISKA